MKNLLLAESSKAQLGRAARGFPPRPFRAELDLAMMASLKLRQTLKEVGPMQVFNVQGMTCGHCVKAVTRAVQGDDPSADVQIDLTKGEVSVQSVLTADRLIGLIKEEGYSAKPA